MKKIALILSVALLASPLFAAAQVKQPSVEGSQSITSSSVSFEVLSETRDPQIESYLGVLGPELQKSFSNSLRVENVPLTVHQQIDLVLTIAPDGTIDALSLESGARESEVTKPLGGQC